MLTTSCLKSFARFSPTGVRRTARPSDTCFVVAEKEDLYGLKKEELQPPPEMEMPEDLEPAQENMEPEPEEMDGSDMSAIIYEIPKEPEK